MKALVFEDRLKLITDAPEPKRGRREALISVRMAGICDTDLQLTRGYMGFRGTLGHEFVGEVLECDDEQWLGKRVVADINAGCGHCTDCVLRDGHHCPTRSVLGILNRNGAFAERLTIPVRCLVEVPSEMEDKTAVFAEPVAAALHVLDECPPDTTEAIVVGDGKLGLLITKALRGAKLNVLCVGHHRRKLDKVAGMGGAGTVLEEQIEEQRIRPAPLVVEATGTQAGLSRAISLTAPRGTLVLKTTIAGNTTVDLTRVVVDELRIVGSRCGSMKRAIAALDQRKLDPWSLVDASYPIDQGERALAHAGERGVLKVLLEF